MKTTFLLLFILVSFFSKSQDSIKVYPFDKWKAKELIEARNFDEITFMDSTEKEILFYCNLVRINPKLFCKTYLQKYVDDYNRKVESDYKSIGSMKPITKFDNYVSTLIATLNDMKKVCVLSPDSNLFNMAKFHASYMKENDVLNHNNFDKLVKKLPTHSYAGENCAYGKSAIDIFMSLLIDDKNVKKGSLGHRENILTTDFTSVGISIQDGYCSMDFANFLK